MRVGGRARFSTLKFLIADLFLEHRISLSSHNHLSNLSLSFVFFLSFLLLFFINKLYFLGVILDHKWVISECTYRKLSDNPYSGTGKCSMEGGHKSVEMFCPAMDSSSVSGKIWVETGDQLKG